MQELSRRIQRLEDIEAIKQLKARYLHACDRKDSEGIRRCFAPGEVVIDYGPIGCFANREELIALFEQMAVGTGIIDAHHAQNPQIHWIDETRAEAIWDLFFFQINPQASGLMQLAGYYEDKYEKRDDEWVITESRFNPTSTVMTSYEQEVLKLVKAGDTPSF